jgi:hypothetical protein
LAQGSGSVRSANYRQAQDKVVQTENDYQKEVFNGDVGTIERIDPVEHEVVVRFDDRPVKYDFGELDEISLAYAITVHNRQGSELAVVIILLAQQQYILLQRNLIGTGIMRYKMLETADRRARNHHRLMRRLPLHRPRVRRVFFQRIVDAIFVMVAHVISNHPTKMLLDQRGNMIRCCAPHPKTPRLHAAQECMVVDGGGMAEV